MTSEADTLPPGAARAGAGPSDFTSPALFTLDYHPVPEALAPFVTTFYHFRCDEREIRDVQPAALGYLIVFLSGEGQVHFADGRSEPSHPVSLLSPCAAAAPTEVDGPFHCVGAALSPLGWAALTGLHAGQWCDRMLSAAQVLGPDAAGFGEEMRRAYHRESADGAALCARLGTFIAARLGPVNMRHAMLIKRVTEWLGTGFDPPLETLFEQSGYSKRQTQRLVERYFGLVPRELKRKYRALRIVALLSQPDLPDADVAALTDCFYDQSHMIREIRHFAGRTPGRLVEDGESILSAMLDVRNFKEIKTRVAPLAPIKGENDSQ